MYSCGCVQDALSRASLYGANLPAHSSANALDLDPGEAAAGQVGGAGDGGETEGGVHVVLASGGTAEMATQGEQAQGQGRGWPGAERHAPCTSLHSRAQRLLAASLASLPTTSSDLLPPSLRVADPAGAVARQGTGRHRAQQHAGQGMRGGSVGVGEAEGGPVLPPAGVAGSHISSSVKRQREADRLHNEAVLAAGGDARLARALQEEEEGSTGASASAGQGSGTRMMSKGDNYRRKLVVGGR